VAATITDVGEPGAVISLAPRRHPARRRLLLAAAAVAVAAAGVAIVGPFDRSDHPDVSTEPTTDTTTDTTAEVVGPADGSPRLLVTAPGWQVTWADEPRTGEGEMAFTGPTGEAEVTWGGEGYYEGRLEEWTSDGEPRDPTTIASHEAVVFASGSEFIALWRDRGYGVELRARVPDAGAFLAVAGSIEPVSPDEWLAALPASTVKPADRATVVDDMLADIPLPAGFDPAPLRRDDGRVTDRYQLGAQVTGAVACSWIGQWVDATSRGDAAAARQAVDAMNSSFDWDVLRQMEPEGGWSSVIWEYATAIATDGTLDGGRPDIPMADEYRMGLGCEMVDGVST
jgi:hypothetical protein